MKITLEKLKISDIDELYEFERTNRLFFEKMLPTRGEDFYQMETFHKRHEVLLMEQAEGGSDFFLIKDEEGTILGRMNLVDIDESQSLAHIGYRVGQEHIRKGIANQALSMLLIRVTEMGIKKLMAMTTANNIASKRVLEKNGFQQNGEGKSEIKMNGQNTRFVYYKWSIQKSTSHQ